MVTSVVDVKDKVLAVRKSISSLPDLIFDGIKSIFVPEEDYINEKVDYLKQQINKLGVSTYDMSAIMGTEKQLDDIEVTMYGTKVTIVDMTVVNTAIDKFRAVIRGLMWLFLVIYNYNQFMGLIGQQSLTLGNMIQSVRNGGSNGDS